jgi:hypothetical protein
VCQPGATEYPAVKPGINPTIVLTKFLGNYIETSSNYTVENIGEKCYSKSNNEPRISARDIAATLTVKYAQQQQRAEEKTDTDECSWERSNDSAGQAFHCSLLVLLRKT